MTQHLLTGSTTPVFLASIYWCQVINTTVDCDQPLMRSNVFTLLGPENHTGSTCPGISTRQSVHNITCTDLPAQTEQTTLLVNYWHVNITTNDCVVGMAGCQCDCHSNGCSAGLQEVIKEAESRWGVTCAINVVVCDDCHRTSCKTRWR